MTTRWVRAAGALLAAAVLTTVPALPALAAPARFTPGQVDPHTPVRPVTPAPAPGAPATPKPGPAAVSWPTGKSAAVTAARADGARGRAEVTVRDRATAAALGVNGLVLTAENTGAPLDLSVDYAGFRDAFGGDWAARLRLVALPACATQTPDRAECRTRTPLPSRNDTTAAKVTAKAAPGTVYALEAAPEGASGDYKATPLAPAGDWQVAAHSGNFSWNHPFRLPPVPGGKPPQLSLGYSSGSVDGRIAGANNQPGWAGEGWDLWPGYLTRAYKACAQDSTVAKEKTGDQCWAGGHHLSFSLNGRSGELVWSEREGFYRAAADDGTRFQLKQGNTYPGSDRFGEYWELTTGDGTRYLFGASQAAQSVWTVPVFGNHPGEPCHTGAFDTSHCDRAWRWNLDRVIDRHGNTIDYTYEKETNGYGLNMGKAKATYTRGGVLRRIDYGTREGVPGPAPARVVLDNADRCAPGTDCARRDAVSYPDVPWDQQCDEATCAKSYGPAFFSGKRLAKITTEVWAEDRYQPVDSWQLNHSFPKPGDTTRGSLWLDSITHSGHVGGTATLPAVRFTGEMKENRVHTNGDDRPQLKKMRLTAIRNEHGGETNITYKPTNCAPGATPKPESNGLRCFPVHWAHEGGIAKDDWFHKYVVDHVSLVDRIGGLHAPAQETHYEYLGDAAWHYHDNELIPQERRSWTQWRGYAAVQVREGSALLPAADRPERELRFFRGMHGDRLAPSGGAKKVTLPDSENREIEDQEALAGFQRGEILRNGIGGPVVTDTVRDAEVKQTAQAHNRTARFTGEARTLTKTTVPGGARRVEKKTRHDDRNLPVEVHDLGDVAVAEDDRCVRTSYARDEPGWLHTLVSRTETVAVGCDKQAKLPEQLVSDERTHYDHKPWGTAPAAGDVTRTERATRFTDGAPHYEQLSRARHDGYGRVLESFDALDRRTTTAYQPETGLAQSTTVVNPLGHRATTRHRVHWGSTESTVDANDKVTTIAHDPLGRITAVWRPGKVAGRDNPHQRFTYHVRDGAGASAITTETLRGEGDYVAEHKLYDGLMRERQTQTPAWTGDRLVTEHIYDTRGLQVRESKPFHALGRPGIDLVESSKEHTPPRQVFTEFDGAKRATATVLKTPTEERRSTTRHFGDHIELIPPPGGTTTATYTDAHGRTTELRQFHGRQPDGAKDVTRYRYDLRGQLETMHDPAGNQLRTVRDLLGNVIESHDPDKGVSKMTYDNAGLLRTKTDSRGKQLRFDYDALNRPTTVHDGDNRLLVKHDYDTVPRGGGKTVLGQPAAQTRQVGELSYRNTVLAYDEAYRPVDTELSLPAAETGLPGSYRTRSSFHPDGSLATLSLPAIADLPAETLLYRYDSLGLLRGMTSPAGTYIRETEFTAYQELSAIRQGPDGAVFSQRSYYDDGTRMVARTLAEREIGTLKVEETTYQRDQADNLTRIRGEGSEGTDIQCFTQDHLRRTTQAWTPARDCGTGPGALGGIAPYRVSLTYDASGNRRTETQHGTTPGTDLVRTYDYPAPGQAQPHALRSVTTAHPDGSRTVERYDNNPTGTVGSRPGKHGGQQELTWNAQGHLAEVKEGDRVTRNVHAVDGTLLLTADPAGRTLHLPHGELRYDTAAKTLRGTRYYTDGKQRTIAVRESGKLYYQVEDPQGTPVLAVEATTHVETRRRLDAFGRPRQAKQDLPGRTGFVGGKEDESTGLTRLGQRDYDPATGRFLSVDPLVVPQDPQSLNGFAYANNNPATFSDPNGTQLMCPVMGDHPAEVCYDPRLEPRKPPQSQSSLPLWLTNDPRRCMGPSLRPLCQPLKPNCSLSLLDEGCVAKFRAEARKREEDAARRRADAERQAREEAERRKRPTVTTLAACTSATTGFMVYAYTEETCELFESTGARGRSTSEKHSVGLGKGFGRSRGYSFKWIGGTIDDAGGTALAFDGSIGPVDGGYSVSLDGKNIGTWGVGTSGALGKVPGPSVGLEFATSTRY